MPTKRFYIIAIIFLSILFLSNNIFVSKNDSETDSNKKKNIQMEIVESKSNQIINFNPTKIINPSTQILNKFLENPFDTKVSLTKEVELKKKIIPFNCPIPKKEYEDMWLFNVGKNTSLPDTTYMPKNLEKISSTYSARINICLTTETLDALKMMLSQAKLDGYTIRATSAFRTFSYQIGLLDTARTNGNLGADTSIAKGGYSEHQLGTAVDLSGLSINFSGADNAFNNTVEAKWLEKYASDYGFIESYPENKTDITGYMYEPWHYRYVGVENAKIIKEKGQTIIEFLAQ